MGNLSPAQRVHEEGREWWNTGTVPVFQGFAAEVEGNRVLFAVRFKAPGESEMLERVIRPAESYAAYHRVRIFRAVRQFHIHGILAVGEYVGNDPDERDELFLAMARDPFLQRRMSKLHGASVEFGHLPLDKNGNGILVQEDVDPRIDEIRRAIRECCSRKKLLPRIPSWLHVTVFRFQGQEPDGDDGSIGSFHHRCESIGRGLRKTPIRVEISRAEVANCLSFLT